MGRGGVVRAASGLALSEMVTTCSFQLLGRVTVQQRVNFVVGALDLFQTEGSALELARGHVRVFEIGDRHA